jgi:hypothetical protein
VTAWPTTSRTVAVQSRRRIQSTAGSSLVLSPTADVPFANPERASAGSLTGRRRGAGWSESHDVVPSARRRLAGRVGPVEHCRAAREQYRRRRGPAEAFDRLRRRSPRPSPSPVHRRDDTAGVAEWSDRVHSASPRHSIRGRQSCPLAGPRVRVPHRANALVAWCSAHPRPGPVVAVPLVVPGHRRKAVQRIRRCAGTAVAVESASGPVSGPASVARSDKAEPPRVPAVASWFGSGPNRRQIVRTGRPMLRDDGWVPHSHRPPRSLG